MLALQDDLSHLDGIEAVTVSIAGGAELPVAHALRRKLNHAEAAPSDGVYTADDVKWFLSTAELALRPTPGTTITDAEGDVWTVQEVARDALNTAWRCKARRLVFAETLADLVDIQRASWNAAAAGDAMPAWAVEQASVPARIQPHELAISNEHEQRTARVTHLIYLSGTIDLDANHRIVHGLTVYHVVRSERSERIDQCTIVHVTQSAWPLG